MRKKSSSTGQHTGGPEVELSRESSHVFKIMSEFVDGFEQLCHVKPAVSIFGSAHVDEQHEAYQQAMQIAGLLSNHGFSIISGEGPGVMESANRGDAKGRSERIGLNISLPREQVPNPCQTLSLYFDHFFARKVMFVKYTAAYVRVALVCWMNCLEQTVCKKGMIVREDMRLFKVVDSPEEVVAEILDYYKDREVLPTHKEMDKLLHL